MCVALLFFNHQSLIINLLHFETKNAPGRRIGPGATLPDDWIAVSLSQNNSVAKWRK
jgi:hypothetical protein